MIVPLQPTGWHFYLNGKAVRLPSTVRDFFYASWEDALWDLLKQLRIPQGSTVLVPSFFCGDVVTNMADHGLTTEFYPVDQNFQTKPSLFATYLKKARPQVVVILHAVGITNRLLIQHQQWMSHLPSDTLLIEDSVHRVVEPDKLFFLTQRHVVMDSLRKVVPLPGSNLFTHPSLKLTPPPFHQALKYQVRVLGWWLVFQLFLHLSLLPFRSWQLFWNQQAEKAMLRGYDVIGDSPEAARGWRGGKWVARRLNIASIHRSKKQQVLLYLQLLESIWQSTKVFQIHFPVSDYHQLRGFPLGLHLSTANQVLARLRSQGVLVRFELNDSPWSQEQKVVYLPLGPHLKDSHIHEVAKAVHNAIV